jgi:pSer/pThr/pTyr-binding forkhead associated (FHA) protein
VLTVKELERLSQSLKPEQFRKQLGPFVLIQRPPNEQRPKQHAEPDEVTNPFGEEESTSVARPNAMSDGTLALLFQFDTLEVTTLPPMEGSEELTVGRLPDCELVIDDASVSKRHAVLRWDAAKSLAIVHDLGSTNGTFINAGPRLKTDWALQDGDIVSFGEVPFWFLLTATLHTKLRQAKSPGSHRSV